jgi:hypothetical protein
MKNLAIRTAAACLYALLAYAGAVAIWDAADSVALYVGLFAWNTACAVLFVYAVTRSTGRSLRFALPVVFCGSLLQVGTVAVFVQESLGQTFASALLALPVFLNNVIAPRPGLFAAWLGLPVLVACIALYLNPIRSRVDAMHT